jgi:hypothetical protein
LYFYLKRGEKPGKKTKRMAKRARKRAGKTATVNNLNLLIWDENTFERTLIFTTH